MITKNIIFIYITAKDKQEAEKIGHYLVKQRLAACVNIVAKINSMYWWKNKIEKSQESLLIAKTKFSLVKKIIKEVKSLHSYSCPCIIALPIVDGNSDYLEWIKNETK